MAGCRSMPDSRNIVGECQDTFSLMRCNEQSCGLGQGRILTLQVLHFGQLLVPLPFETASYQSVLWINGNIATARQVGLILCSLQTQLPLAINLLGTSLQLVKRRQRNRQMSWLDGLQETGSHSLINPIAAHRLARLLCYLRMSLPAFVTGHVAIKEVAHIHPTPTDSTQDYPLQQG